MPPSTKSGGLYERVYLWLRARNPALFGLGRMTMWALRKVRAYPGLTGGYLLLLAALTAGGFVEAFEPLGPLLWVLAGVLGLAGMLGLLAGFNRFVVKEARYEFARGNLELRHRLDDEVDRLEALRHRLDDEVDRLEAELEAQTAARKAFAERLMSVLARTGQELATIRASLDDTPDESEVPDRATGGRRDAGD